MIPLAATTVPGETGNLLVPFPEANMTNLAVERFLSQSPYIVAFLI